MLHTVEEILHHLGCHLGWLKPCTKWGKPPINWCSFFLFPTVWWGYDGWWDCRFPDLHSRKKHITVNKSQFPGFFSAFSGNLWYTPFSDLFFFLRKMLIKRWNSPHFHHLFYCQHYLRWVATTPLMVCCRWGQRSLNETLRRFSVAFGSWLGGVRFVMGVPPNHPFIDRFFHYQPSIWGYPHLWKPPFIGVINMSWESPEAMEAFSSGFFPTIIELVNFQHVWWHRRVSFIFVWITTPAFFDSNGTLPGSIGLIYPPTRRSFFGAQEGNPGFRVCWKFFLRARSGESDRRQSRV